MKKMSIAVKLIGGFVLVACITLMVGLVGWYGAVQISSNLDKLGKDNLPCIQSLLTMSGEFETIKVAMRTLVNPQLTLEERQRQYANIEKARERYLKAFQVFEATPMSAETSNQWKELTAALALWRQQNNDFLQMSHDLEKMGILSPIQLMANVQEFRGDHYRLLFLAEELMDTGTPFDGGEDPKACALGKWMAAYKTENPRIISALQEITKHHDGFHQSVRKIKELVKAGERQEAAAAYKRETKPASEGVLEHLQILTKEAGAAVQKYGEMNNQTMVVARVKEAEVRNLIAKMVESETKEVAESAEHGQVVSNRVKLSALIGMSTGFALALALGVFLSLSISRPLKRIIEGLSGASEQVASASGQISSASQQLAEGASEQAAAIEETSSSMEEMSSMTRQNADNATQANNIMREANNVAIQANESMNRLTSSMVEISTASDETQKIIKTIDEIAFQTNLLALNAAVEAARAGEAGAGFAVVADEVRNLAMRAADAAKNTAGLIEGTVKRVKEGTSIVETTNQGFQKVTETVGRSVDLVAEIAAASNEQAQGIDQINKAVAEMDKVVQQNAASAEESASASEEMSAQAEQMKAFVHDLQSLVGGGNGKANAAMPTGRKQPRSDKAMDRASLMPVPIARANGGNARHYPAAQGRELTRPSEVLPLDESEFSDF
jgi:methyl-accepting chemotaxis protein